MSEPQPLFDGREFYLSVIGIIIVFTIYKIFLYIRLRSSLKNLSEEQCRFRIYPCYLNLILSLSVLINNILRVIRFGQSEHDFPCNFQAFCLITFDKMIMTRFVIYSFIQYCGLYHGEYTRKNFKKLFIITNVTGTVISLGSGALFTIMGIKRNKNICYSEPTTVKEVIDIIMNFLLFLIFLFCILKSLMIIVNNIKESMSKDYVKFVDIWCGTTDINSLKIKNYLKHFYRILGTLYIFGGLFVLVILIIRNSLFTTDDYIDLTFVICCFLADLFYSINSTIINETLILFGCREREEEDKPDDLDEERKDYRDEGEALDDSNLSGSKNNKDYLD